MFDFIAQKFSSLFSQFKGGLTQGAIDNFFIEIETGLLEADVPYNLVQDFVKQLKDDKRITSLKKHEQLVQLVHDQLILFLGGANQARYSFVIPSTIMVMGLQGAGKTTTVAKLAWHVVKEAKKKNKKRKILAASVDFYRPAAIDQLEIVSKQAGIDFYRANATNAVEAAREIQAYARMNGYELLFLDTAGRLHVDNSMLLELKNIDNVVGPRYKMLVLDAMTGQESLAVAQAFDQAIGFNAAVLSKADSDSRGGAAFSFRYALKKPIAFVGIGEKLADLELFHPERAAKRMLGLGDIDTLLEKADEHIKENEQKKMQRSWESGTFNLDDFSQQMGMINRLGSFSKLMKYMPGMGSMKISDGMLEQGEKEMGRFKAILSSMTLKERVCPKILNGSRKTRIARGAGVGVQDVDKLLSRFEQMQQYAKLLKKSGGIQNMFRGR